MKKGLIIAAAAMLCVAAAGGGLKMRAQAEEVELSCKAAYLMDEASGVQLYAKNEETRLPIPSMLKIIALLPAFEAVYHGELSYAEEITLPERPAVMGGSQVCLGAGLTSLRADR